MATWIAHLRIAEVLLEQFPGLEAHAFAVGNIAPDSGMPDEKWETFSPPTEVTHVQAPEAAMFSCADLDFYRRNLVDLPWPGTEPPRYSFIFGYFCHLVTDNLWSLRIGKPTYQRFSDKFQADRNFVWEVKKDWYGLDFEYVRAHPDCLYWKVFLTCDYPVNYLSFLRPEGVRERICYIQRYYQLKDAHAEELVNRKRIYLTAEEMDGFIEEAARRLAYIYVHLRIDRIFSNEFHSSLELMDDL